MAGYAPVKHRLQSQFDLKHVIGIDMRTHWHLFFSTHYKVEILTAPVAHNYPLKFVSQGDLEYLLVSIELS